MNQRCLEKERGLVAKMIPFSAVDGPGNRFSIFLQGCRFNCLYCHNPETIPLATGPHNPDIKIMTVGQITKAVDKFGDFLSGVTISGGECTVQFEFLLSLTKALSQKGYEVLIDTNGDGNRNIWQALLPFTQGFMVDWKAADEEEHKMLTGRSNTQVVEAIHILAKEKKLYEMRTVVVPNILNNEKTVQMGAQIISSYNPCIRYKLIRYRNHGVRENLLTEKSPTQDYMEKLAGLAQKQGCENVIIV